jgi:DNA-binding MarR family transcriptional regulator
VRKDSDTKDQPTPRALPCACANLRRASRAVTRLYNRELRATGLEVTQYTLLMALDLRGEAPQGELGKLLALDTTTLTRMLAPLQKRGWIADRPGTDRRQRLLRLTASGREKLLSSRPQWERAQTRFQQRLGGRAWRQMDATLAAVVCASTEM